MNAPVFDFLGIYGLFMPPSPRLIGPSRFVTLCLRHFNPPIIGKWSHSSFMSGSARILGITTAFFSGFLCCLLLPCLGATQSLKSASGTDDLAQSFRVGGKVIDTKAYLDQAWEAKGRPGLFANGGMIWEPATRQWHVKPGLPRDFSKAIAHYASWTATAAGIGINIARTYHELNLIDELAAFYSAFLKANFTTLGELRNTHSSEIKLKLLGPDLGPDTARTLAWYAEQPDGSVVLRDCYLCNADYFYPTATLIRIIAMLKPAERTPAMTQFVAEYVPLLVNEHLLRPGFAERMRADMKAGNPPGSHKNMINDEIEVVGSSAELLGATAADSHLVVIAPAELAQLKDLVKAGVERFQFSRTITKDADGRTRASYFNGDYDWHEDMDFAGYRGEKFPTSADKAKAKGVSWDISHFSIVPMFLRSLFDNKAATGVDFPQKADIEYIGNQYAFQVFEGDYKKLLFRNFFDGTDGWYRVSYLGRSSYGIAPSIYCNMFDPSHGCLTIAGIYSWGFLAPLHPDIAKIQFALLDLARSSDPSIACFQPACFRERYYRYGDASFSFLDSDGKIQYPPALIVILSQLVVPLDTARGAH